MLRYFRNETKRFHTFVANRIAIIRDGSDPDQWRHVGGDLNPADDLSRGLSAEALLNLYVSPLNQHLGAGVRLQRLLTVLLCVRSI